MMPVGLDRGHAPVGDSGGGGRTGEVSGSVASVVVKLALYL